MRTGRFGAQGPASSSPFRADLRDPSTTREGEFRDRRFRVPIDRVRLPPPGAGPGIEEGRRGLLGRPYRSRRTEPGGRRCAGRRLEAARRRRDRRGGDRRFLAVRPRARHHRHGRCRPGPASCLRRGGPARRVFRDGARHAGRAAAGDDEVVRHELPLPGARARPGHRVHGGLVEAGGGTSPRPGGWGTPRARCWSGR